MKRNVITAQHAARRESPHAVALAARTATLTESIYVGCKSDGTCAAGVNGNSQIPFSAGSATDWIICNLAGFAADNAFGHTSADRQGASRDDIVAEKILRATWQPDEWNMVLTWIEGETSNLISKYRACIEELAAAVLAQPPRTVAVLGEDRLVYKLGADKIEEILTKHGLRTPRRFGCGYTDEDFTRLPARKAQVECSDS